MNKAIENMMTRRSVRKYKPDMVSRDMLDQVMLAGEFAASGKGKQPSVIVAVTNRILRDKLSDMNRRIGGWDEGFDPFYGAPAVLVVLADKSTSTYVYDGSLVIGNMMLAAHSLGLGTCWIHRAKEEFESEEGKEILKDLGIEGDYEGIGHCIIGYPDGPLNEPAKRKDDFIYYAD